MKKENLKVTGHVKAEFRNVITGEVTIIENHNLVTTVGLTSMAGALRGNTLKGYITYCAVGTDNTTPVLADTVLGTEIARKLVSVRSNTLGVASFQTFYNTSEANGSIEEAGLFGDSTATATADSGTLFCHTLFSRVKTSSETLTLTWTVTIA